MYILQFSSGTMQAFNIFQTGLKETSTFRLCKERAARTGNWGGGGGGEDMLAYQSLDSLNIIYSQPLWLTQHRVILNSNI